MYTKRIQQYQDFVCDVCREHFYREEFGDGMQDVAAGTLATDLPKDWRCPCGATKESLRPVLSIGSTAW